MSDITNYTRKDDRIKCPYCFTLVQVDWSYSKPFEGMYYQNPSKKIFFCDCTSCNKLIIDVVEAIFDDLSGTTIFTDVTLDERVYPKSISNTVSEHVPYKYAVDYQEAIDVLPISPKSSAALTRRILQEVIREEYGIKKRSLDGEIEDFINLPTIPTYIGDAIDAVRLIGNFAVHTKKDLSTGEVVEVENGEAEWLIEVIDNLFDFTFVQPKKLEERRNKLVNKLEAIGKSELKIRNTN